MLFLSFSLQDCYLWLQTSENARIQKLVSYTEHLTYARLFENKDSSFFISLFIYFLFITLEKSTKGQS